MTKRIAAFLTILLSALMVSAAVAQDDATMSISELVTDGENFTILERALGMTDLELSADSTYTVFAPTDEAFQGLAELNEITVDELLTLLSEQGVLDDVLSYHVVAEEALTSENITEALENDAESTFLLTTLDETDIEFELRLTDRIFVNGFAEVLTADIEATNGVVHAIGSVLIPADVQEEIGIQNNTEM